MVTIIPFPRLIYITQMLFFEDLTGKHLYNLAYELHFLHTDLPTLHKRAFFHNNSAIIDLSRMLSYAVCYKKNNATVKFVVFCWQPSSQDLCVNIAHIRSKTFRCVRKYIKLVKVSFQVLIKWYTLGSYELFSSSVQYLFLYKRNTLKAKLCFLEIF